MAAVLSGCAHHLPEQKAEKPFVFQRDTFAFANETVWNYRDGTVQRMDDRNPPEEGERYTRRCFVLSRAAVQFWKFARFAPADKKLDEAALAKRVRELARIEVWRDPLPMEKRVVFPGYADVRGLSRAEGRVLRKNLGLGWPTYFRPGNNSMFPLPGPGNQQRVKERLDAAMELGHPVLLWLINFPSLSINHAVVVHRKAGPSEYEVYDPNYKDGPKRLSYHRERRCFLYEKTFYFPGGEVDVHPVFDGPLQ